MPKERLTRHSDNGLILIDEEELAALNDDDEDDDKLFKEIYEPPQQQRLHNNIDTPYLSYFDERRVTTVFHASYLATTSLDMLFFGFLVVFGLFQSLSLFIVATLAVVVVMALLGTATIGITKKFSSPMFVIGMLRLCYDLVLLCFSVLLVALLVVTPTDSDAENNDDVIKQLLFIMIFLSIVAFYLSVSGVCICSSFMLGYIYREQDLKYHYVRTYNEYDEFQLQIMNPPSPPPSSHPSPLPVPIPSKQVSYSNPPFDPLYKPQTTTACTTSTVSHQPLVVGPQDSSQPEQTSLQLQSQPLVEEICIGKVEMEYGDDDHQHEEINVAYDGDDSSSEADSSDNDDSSSNDSDDGSDSGSDNDDIMIVESGDVVLGKDEHQQ